VVLEICQLSDLLFNTKSASEEVLPPPGVDADTKVRYFALGVFVSTYQRRKVQHGGVSSAAIVARLLLLLLLLCF
jgi:hypothetical protein